MDAIYTGNMIAARRKELGFTQKELAERLHVTEELAQKIFITSKAVSKWERGINFPDIALLEKVAAELQFSVIDLLGIENESQEQIVSSMTDLAKTEKELIAREIINRGWLTVILGIIVLAAEIYASRIFADNNLYGIPQSLTGGMSGVIGLIISNGIVSIWKGKKL